MKKYGIVMAVVAIGVMVSVNVQAGQEVILHPGYIDVNVFIPDGLGGEYTIDRIYAYANGTDPEGNPHSSTGTFYDDEFTLIVEGGDWTYTVRIEAYYGGNYNNRVRWYKQVVVGRGHTVPVTFETDSFIEGTISVSGETVTQTRCQASAYGASVGDSQYGFYSRAQIDGDNYRLPVVGGTAMYRVYSQDTRLTVPNDDKPNLYTYMNLGYKNTSVASGVVEVVDFNITPGYVEGTVTLDGANFTGNCGTVSVRVRDQQTNQYLYCSSWLAEDGTYRMPVAPGTYVRCYGNVYTDQGNHSLTSKYLTTDLLPEATLYCDWEIIFDGSISGEIAITGINLDRIQVYGYGPNGAYRSETIYSPGEYQEYQWDDVVPGQWGIRFYAWDYEYDALIGIRDYDYYYSATETVDVPSEGHSIVDFNMSPGFIEGNLMAENSASLLPLNDAAREAAQLYRAYVYAYPSPYQSYPRAYTYNYDYDLEDEHNVNRYDMFVEPGVWQVHDLRLYFRTSFFPEEYNGSCELRITERNPSTGEYTAPLLSIEENETAECDFGYQTGRIDARLAVSSGELVSNPYVNGYYLWNPDGVWDKQVSIYGNSSVSNLVQAKVALLALPGTYRLTARGYVEGTNASFGNPWDVSVGEGDVIIVDPEAPTVDIEIPPGNYQTPEDSVLFAGTITDESAIASLTINGTEVTINEDGSFELEVPDLQHGENQVELTCCDVQENCVTVVRTVIMNNSPIAAAGDDQTVNTGPEGMAQVTLDGSDSNDVDGDELTYKWLLDGAKIAAGVNPTIELTSCGTHTIELTVNDGMADSEPNYVDITVMDNTPPTIACPNDVTIECGESTDPSNTGEATATDNCDDSPIISYSDSISGSCPTVITRTWTAGDASGNSSSCMQTITVQDTTPPVITGVPADETVECDSVPAPAEPTAADNCDQDVPVIFGETRTDGDCPNRYTLTRTWTATDECGNSTNETQVITVQDTTPPVISGVPANEIVECDTVPAPANPTSSDNCDPDVPVSFNETRTDGDCPNRYTLTRTWTATDDCGNTTTKIQVITVQDTTPPVFAIVPEDVNVWRDGNGNIAELNAWLASAVEAIDNCGSVAITNDYVSFPYDCGNTGSLTVTWTATDECGNTTTMSATFTIDDPTAGVTYDGDLLLSTEGAATIDASLTAILRDDTGNLLDIDGEDVTFTLTAEGVGTIVETAVTQDGVAGIILPFEPAIYMIKVTLGCSEFTSSAILVVYNPEGGFATGGGWLVPLDDSLNTYPNQRANFGFNAKYKKGDPTGHIEFRYSDGHIDLKSTSVDQLVITGGKIVQFKGLALVNGVSGYSYFVKGIDKGQQGTSDVFDIKIWAPSVSTEGDPTERAGGTLSGGNIVVHTK